MTPDINSDFDESTRFGALEMTFTSTFFLRRVFDFHSASVIAKNTWDAEKKR